jgi:hypothetical protein
MANVLTSLSVSVYVLLITPIPHTKYKNGELVLLEIGQWTYDLRVQ